MDDELFRQFSLLPHAELRNQARGRELWESAVLTGGSAPNGKNGLVGLNVGVGRRQTRFWLPADHPCYPELASLVRRAIKNGHPVQVEIDPVGYVLLDAKPAPDC